MSPLKNPLAAYKLKCAFIGDLSQNDSERIESCFELIAYPDFSDFQKELAVATLQSMPEVILIREDDPEQLLIKASVVRSHTLGVGALLILISDGILPNRELLSDLAVDDFYNVSVQVDDLIVRIADLVRFKLLRSSPGSNKSLPWSTYQMPWSKRLFDMTASLSILLFLSPLLLIIAACIRLESKGPVIYRSKRAGAGYRVFDFYKFRSMRPGADKELKTLSLTANQYGAAASDDSAFVKIKDDPRITRVGAFIRNTSIDELPQLFNVLIGDMSLVGNRPLPLYEAEKLTSNEWARRFLGPAGITGLWQISKRGKAEMSDRERRELDNHYAQHYSLLFDLKIILSTFPALLQKEKV